MHYSFIVFTLKYPAIATLEERKRDGERFMVPVRDIALLRENKDTGLVNVFTRDDMSRHFSVAETLDEIIETGYTWNVERP